MRYRGATGLRAIIACSLLMGTSAADAARKVVYTIRDTRSRFEATEVARQAADDAAARLVSIAQSRFGITLDGSELSVIELQRLAEMVRGDYLAISDAAEQDRQRAEWLRLFGGYFGDLLVRHRGAVWGKTDWMGSDDDRALGFPATRGISLPFNQVGKAFAYPSSLCGWYLIAASGEKGGELPAAISDCDARGFMKTPEEEARLAASAAYLKQLVDEDTKLRATQRTPRELRLVVGTASLRAADEFHTRKVKGPARFTFGFTVTSRGTVTDVHKIGADFEDPALDEALLDIVRGLKFEPRDVPDYVCPGLVFAFTE